LLPAIVTTLELLSKIILYPWLRTKVLVALILMDTPGAMTKSPESMPSVPVTLQLLATVEVPEIEKPQVL
jgi:hypothetical protein